MASRRTGVRPRPLGGSGGGSGRRHSSSSRPARRIQRTATLMSWRSLSLPAVRRCCPSACCATASSWREPVSPFSADRQLPTAPAWGQGSRESAGSLRSGASTVSARRGDLDVAAALPGTGAADGDARSVAAAAGYPGALWYISISRSSSQPGRLPRGTNQPDAVARRSPLGPAALQAIRRGPRQADRPVGDPSGARTARRRPGVRSRRRLPALLPSVLSPRPGTSLIKRHVRASILRFPDLLYVNVKVNHLGPLPENPWRSRELRAFAGARGLPHGGSRLR